MICNTCPRKCNVDRTQKAGFCHAKDNMVISKVMLHQYEEPILVGKADKGSGAIFFSGCNLGCVYCQNYAISHSIIGQEVSPKQLAEIFKKLERAGAGNIDLVSPTHYTNKIVEALRLYKPKVPVIWNSNGYESEETLKQLNGLVDIYLVDFKYSTDSSAELYSKAKNYVKNAKNALIEMKKQQNSNIFDKEGKLIKGIIVRHLVLPSLAKESVEVLDIVKEILGKDAIISIMSQYVPMGEAEKYSQINRKITSLEYKIVTNHALKLGFKNAFVQDFESSSAFYTPDFKSKVFEI